MILRFHLQKYKSGNKGICPQCHRKYCFVKYIDEESKIIFPDYVGRCDHESSCGYHYTPRIYFKDKSIEIPKSENYSKSKYNAQCSTHKIISYIDDNIVQATFSHYSLNPLFLFFSKIFGHENAMKLFIRYRVGTASVWNGSTVYWQTDLNGKVRTGKVMDYNPENGHRIKEPMNRINWVHSLLKIQNFNIKQCLFGEHLLKKNNAEIAIVESEKTAMIASYFIPNYIWLATGGKNGCFNLEAMKVLNGREVCLFPDLQAYDDWKSKEYLLKEVGCKVKTSDFLEKNANAAQKACGLDIGDFLLIDKTDHQILYDLIQKNPMLNKLIDKLQLQFVDDNYT